MQSRTLLALVGAGILACSAGCGASHKAVSAGAGHNIQVLGAARRAGVKKSVESGYAKRFMKLVPAGAVGYPAFGLVVGPLAASSSVSPHAKSIALARFKRLRVARALLGKLLVNQVPAVVLRTVTEYQPAMPDIGKGSSFPAVIITYHKVTCNVYGKPGTKFHSYTCTTMAVFNLRSGKWLGIDQF